MIFSWIIVSRSSYGLNCRLCFTEGTVFAALGVSTEHNSTDEKTCTVSLAGFRLYELNKHKLVFDCFI